MSHFGNWSGSTNPYDLQLKESRNSLDEELADFAVKMEAENLRTMVQKAVSYPSGSPARQMAKLMLGSEYRRVKGSFPKIDDYLNDAEMLEAIQALKQG